MAAESAPSLGLMDDDDLQAQLDALLAQSECPGEGSPGGLQPPHPTVEASAHHGPGRWAADCSAPRPPPSATWQAANCAMGQLPGAGGLGFDALLELFDVDMPDSVTAVMEVEKWSSEQSRAELNDCDSLLEEAAALFQADSPEPEGHHHADGTSLDLSDFSLASPIVGSPEVPQEATASVAPAPGDCEMAGEQAVGAADEHPGHLGSKQLASLYLQAGSKEDEGTAWGPGDPGTNEVTQFCNMVSQQLEEEGTEMLASASVVGYSDLPMLHSGFGVKAKDGLGLRASKLGQKGKGRVRQKDHVEVLEQYVQKLKAQQAELSKHIDCTKACVSKRDSLLTMKAAAMGEVKATNTALDSQLQETVMTQVARSLEGLSMEDRGRATTLSSIFLTGKPQEKVERLQVLQDSYKDVVLTAAWALKDLTTPEADQAAARDRLALCVANLRNLVMNQLPETGGTLFMHFIKEQVDSRAEYLGPQAYAEQFKKVAKGIKLSPALMRKLYALNTIYVAKTRSLLDHRRSIHSELVSGSVETGWGFIDQARQLQRTEELILGLRENFMSMVETRSLFNLGLYRVIQPTDLAMFLVHLYPQMPDPQAISCALLGVDDMADVTIDTYREYFSIHPDGVGAQ